MGTILMLIGFVATIGGVCLLVYQSLMYLMYQTWPAISIMSTLEAYCPNWSQQLISYPGLASHLNSAPLWACLLVIGLLVMWFGFRQRNRYV